MTLARATNSHGSRGKRPTAVFRRVMAALGLLATQLSAGVDPVTVLPGTAPLVTAEVDMRAETIGQLNRFLVARTEDALRSQKTHWTRDISSEKAFQESVTPNRERLRQRIGAVGPRVPIADLTLVGSLQRPALLEANSEYEILAVSWPVFEGVDAEGLLLRPVGPIKAGVVVLPDADQAPESLLGAVGGSVSSLPRLLAKQGAAVLIPTLIDRRDLWSGDDRLRKYSDQSHREWIYRQAAVVGRHIIGYEVQKVEAALDWLEKQCDGPIGVAGYGEGGLLAFYTGALNPRVDVVLTSGYFTAREGLWQEPLYRNVWRLLEEFGDAEIASLMGARALIAEFSEFPAVEHPPKVPFHSGATLDRRTSATRGRIETPRWSDAHGEWERARTLLPPGFTRSWQWVDNGKQGPTRFGSAAALAALQVSLGFDRAGKGEAPAKAVSLDPADNDARMHRQFVQLQDYTQKLGRFSEYEREEFFWKRMEGATTPEEWSRRVSGLRKEFSEELIGRFAISLGGANARSRLLPEYENPKWSAYELLLEVWPGVDTWAYILLPKDLKPGERRPVVVCQHGAAGDPSKVISRPDQPNYSKALRGFAAELADRGFVVLAPYNPNAIMGQPFLDLSRRASPLGKSLFSLITANHERLLLWLKTQPFTDPARIAFYGLSYGGKTAMRVPALLPDYCLSICSGDWNHYVPKMMSVRRDRNTFMFTAQHDTIEFNMANTFAYAEMAALIAPRPFMVENGYKDRVMSPEWASREYAKVARLYHNLGIPERTEMEYFDGPHEINGVGTFRFLHRHLQWPEPQPTP